MSRGIPKVREWIIRVGDLKFRVLGPTKTLAILNLREVYRAWGFPITSVGVVRKPVGQTSMVVEETGEGQNCLTCGFPIERGDSPDRAPIIGADGGVEAYGWRHDPCEQDDGIPSD